MKHRRANIIIIMTILVMLAITGVPCYAGSLIYGCVKDNGQLRIVHNPTLCTPSEKSVSLLSTSGIYGKGCVNERECSCNDSADILLSGGALCSSDSQHLVASYAEVYFRTWYAKCADSSYNEFAPGTIGILCMKP